MPGTSTSVVCVGAVAVEDFLHVAPFSSFGPTRDGREKPDLVAPGVNVVGAMAGSLTGIAPSSGTSMAAPHVSGAIALLLSAAASGPRRSWPNAMQIRAALVASSRDLTGRWSKRRGYGRLQVDRFVETLLPGDWGREPAEE